MCVCVCTTHYLVCCKIFHTCLLWSGCGAMWEQNPSGSPTPKEELSKYWLSFKLSKNLSVESVEAMKRSPTCRWFIGVSQVGSKCLLRWDDPILHNQPSQKMSVVGLAYWFRYIPKNQVLLFIPSTVPSCPWGPGRSLGGVPLVLWQQAPGEELPAHLDHGMAGKDLNFTSFLTPFLGDRFSYRYL